MHSGQEGIFDEELKVNKFRSKSLGWKNKNWNGIRVWEKTWRTNLSNKKVAINWIRFTHVLEYAGN